MTAISKECASYCNWHQSAQWLIDHAGDEVEILDVGKDCFPVFTVKSLRDGTIGKAWQREIIK